jgi:hypothetical protein
MTIDVSGQVLDVIFRMRSKLTTSDVTFDPPSVDFGPCFTDRTVSYPIKITNHSALPQKFGFVKLPREMTVPYQDGFGTLLPCETIERNLLFSPVSATDHDFSLTFSTYMNRTFNIQCHGVGVKPPLSFSTTNLLFACTTFGEKVEKSVFVKNTSKHEQIYEFGTPKIELAGLTISPKCMVLSPGATVRVEVVFDPSLVNVDAITYPVEKEEEEKKKDLEESKEEGKNEGGQEGGDEGGEEGGAKDGEEGESSNQDGQPSASAVASLQLDMPSKHEASFQRSSLSGDEPLSYHSNWNVPCFVKEKNPRNAPRSPRSARAAASLHPVQTLEIRTTTLAKRKLECVVPPDTLSKLTMSTPTRLDFGQMAVGQEEIAPLKLTNIHEGPVNVRLKQGPNVQGPFSIVNALRPLSGYGGKEETMTAYVRFKPEDQLVYCERIEFETEFGTASVVLVGQGVSPTLELTPSVSCNFYLFFCC